MRFIFCSEGCVGTGGGCRVVWGPCACPGGGLHSQQGQAQGPPSAATSSPCPYTLRRTLLQKNEPHPLTHICCFPIISTANNSMITIDPLNYSASINVNRV